MKMKGMQVLLGILGYLIGVVAAIVLALIVSGGVGLLRLIDSIDLIILIVGCSGVALGALAFQNLEYSRPSASARREGSRPTPDERRWLSNESYIWSTLAMIIGASVAFAVAPAVSANEDRVFPARGTFEELVIDGDRDGISVVLDHDHANDHISKNHGVKACGWCHHLNYPGEEATPCSECHRSKSEGTKTDIFDHYRHADFMTEQSGGNEGCQSCHPADENDVPRRRDTVVNCVRCHAPEGDHIGAPGIFPMVPSGIPVKMGEGAEQGFARSYVEAMHAKCIGCHEQEIENESIRAEKTRCLNCHPSGGVTSGPR